MPTSLEVGRFDFWAFQQFVTRARHRDETIDHYIAAMRELQGMIGILLDQKYGQTILGIERFDRIEDLSHDQRGEAERRLIEKE
jgi:hypothetical protein